MNKKLSKPFELVIYTGLSFFLMLSTIDGILTTKVTLDQILFLRHISWGGLISCVFVLIAFARRSFKEFWVVSVPLMVLLAWAGGVTYLYSRDFFYLSDFVYVLIASLQGVMGAYLLSMSSPDMLRGLILRFFYAYGIVAFLLILISGGISFKYPARFNFEELSGMFGGQVLYSQGMSRLFGFAAIFYALGLVSSAKAYQYLIFGFLLLGSIFLCLLGGARGESFFAVFLVLFICLWRYRIRFLLFSAAVALILHLLVTDWAWLNDFVVFQRYSVLGDLNVLSELGRASRYGYREVLLQESYRLLADNPNCLLLGCGLGYFQRYYNYPLGMYPHNELVELVITHGAFLAVSVLVSVSAGFVAFVKQEPGPGAVAFLYVYSLLLALKGGTVFSNGLFVALSLYFFVQAWWFAVNGWSWHSDGVSSAKC